MILNNSNELITMHVGLGCGYNRPAVKMVLGKADHDHVQTEFNRLVCDHKLEGIWKTKSSTKFTSTFNS